MASAPLRRAALGALAVTLISLAACSSSGSDSATGTTPGKATTTTAPAASGPLDRYAGYETVNYDDPAHWVCRPDTDDICDSDLDATVVEADGTLTVEPFEPAADAPIDCFYVYPTISQDEGTYSDWDASDDEEGYVTLNQAARLQSQCRLYAPVYRQTTLGGLSSLIGGGEPAPEEGDPYADVLDAFRTYMAQDNDGRGVVLVGHSQGTGMLAQLIAEEIDPNEDVRALLVSAYLAGGSITVPEGEVVGGEFEHIPMCTSADETGCVVTWSTFRATAPPPAGSFFGRPGEDGLVSACVNPAAIAGGAADLDTYMPANSEASILSSLGTSTEGRSWIDGTAGEITTPFVRLPELSSGECATTADAVNYLSVSLNPETDGPRADDFPGDLSPEWGLHLVDINLVMGNMVTDVAAQAAAYTSS